MSVQESGSGTLLPVHVPFPNPGKTRVEGCHWGSVLLQGNVFVLRVFVALPSRLSSDDTGGAEGCGTGGTEVPSFLFHVR